MLALAVWGGVERSRDSRGSRLQFCLLGVHGARFVLFCRLINVHYSNNMNHCDECEFRYVGNVI